MFPGSAASRLLAIGRLLQLPSRGDACQSSRADTLALLPPGAAKTTVDIRLDLMNISVRRLDRPSRPSGGFDPGYLEGGKKSKAPEQRASRS